MDRSMTFGQAIAELKNGKMVARDNSTWRYDECFIFMQVPSEINRTIVPKMQSLPQAVKDEFEKRFNDEILQINAIYYQNQLAIVYKSNLICGYAPSTEDALANDWYVYGT